MLKDIKNLLKRNLKGIAILITISIAILSLVKIGKQPIQLNNLDKYEHVFAYFVLNLIWLLALKKTKINEFLIVFCCFFYGIIIEALQVTITSYRSGDVLDIVANTTGILIAYIIYFLFLRKM
ncbi:MULTISPECIES: VanZ family protein [Tenacibaculum]|uniref:VanZ family protein n=1 Tax=Tenacibaculum TaxID=104267 RepID=UPI0021B07DC3|nr:MULTISPECIES: VanZ family protein [Tenacibaculum]MCT4700034.1 VanZ family protein [Tenacibaculum haliotis]WBX71025.1 VanZ family protein [Tenacibaculum retecalamus]